MSIVAYHKLRTYMKSAGYEDETIDKLLRSPEIDPYAQNIEQSDEVEVTYCKNKDEAQALANFLWNEKERHLKDIHVIMLDLALLKVKWEVKPLTIVRFVKP